MGSYITLGTVLERKGCRMVQYQIVNGPSKRDLELALFDGDSQHRRHVVFSFEEHYGESGKSIALTVRAFILNGVSREDGSGESWLINGYFAGAYPPIPIKGYFSTKTRKGHLEF